MWHINLRQDRTTVFWFLILCLVLPCSAQLTLKPNRVTNIRTGMTYDKIQSAIDQAVDGDVLEIEAGQYPETLRIEKDLALIGKERVYWKRFHLNPEPKSDTAPDFMDFKVIHISFGATVVIKNMTVQGIRGVGGEQVGARSIITNNGYLKLDNVMILNNRTMKGAVVNKHDGANVDSGELYTNQVRIAGNLGMESSGKGGGVKNHGIWEGWETDIVGNGGTYGGIYNSDGETMLLQSQLYRNYGNYGAFYNTSGNNKPGYVLGFRLLATSNQGATASDFQDPNRGDCLDPNRVVLEDCETACPGAENPCGTYHGFGFIWL